VSTPTPVTSPRGPYANTPRRKAEIVAAAAHIFAQVGYHGGSLRQIARDLDLSFTSVKHHFPTKEELLIAVLEANDELEVVRVHSDKTALGFIDSALELAKRNLHARESVRLLAVLAAEASAPEHPAHTWFTQRYERIRLSIAQSIAEDVEAGRLPASTDAEAVAGQIIGLWDGLQLQWLIDPQFDMIHAMRDGITALLHAETNHQTPGHGDDTPGGSDLPG